MAPQVLCKVDLRLLPFKVHYFFYFGALGGVIPYLPVLAKDLGINAGAVGVIYVTVPFVVFLSKPFIGCLVDYFQNIKIFLLCFLVIPSVTAFSFSLIPSIPHNVQDSLNIELQLPNYPNKSIILSPKYEKSCMISMSYDEIRCNLILNSKGNNSKSYVQMNDSVSEIKVNVNSSYSVDLFLPDSISLNLQNFSDANSLWILQVGQNLDIENAYNDLDFNSSSIFCQPNIGNCLLNENSNLYSVYTTFQFWIFTLLAVISFIGTGSCISLTDVACCEMLGDERGNYGRQRLWGTIGWAVVCSIAGLLNDVATKINNKKDYSPGFYLMVAFVLVDVAVLARIDIKKTKFSTDMCKDISSIFSSCDIIIFALGTIINGFLSSVVYNYEFWFLEDMGASQTLCGLTVVMQCIIGELPFFIISGWFINKFGHFNCVACSFIGFVVRLGLYSLIKNPWLALPIDVLHGLTFAMFHASMTGFASARAPAGLEATMLGMFGGLRDGLGIGLGSLIGGQAVDILGSRNTFFYGSIISSLSAVLFLIAHQILKYIRKTERDNHSPEILDDNLLKLETLQQT